VFKAPVGQSLIGRVLNGLGEPIDGKGPLKISNWVSINQPPPHPLERSAIEEPLVTGVRVIDGMLTCGKGQRMGIFAGSGVGKSTLLGSIARNSESDISVIALIGERGREVNEFLQRDLGPEGLARSVVVVATSDEPALVRVQAALAATTVAEFFRDRGQHVLLMMDSITRFAMAQREIGLAAGEPPTTRGYPPSVFALLPRLVERAGLTAHGSITAFYSVLVEGDDTNEPVSDTVRGLLDGHTVLSRRMAGRGHYPAVDLLESISRLMPDLVTPEQREAARTVRELIAVYREHEDLITIGAYPAGSNPLVDAAIAMKPEIDRFLRQDMNESSDFETTVQALRQLAHRCRQPAKPAAPRHATHETKEHRPT
jgi:FliI/YscN family ATPase